MNEQFENYNPPPDLLKDRAILVTGAGDGIGKAAALAFARHGASVILLGRTIAKLESVYDEIENAGAPQPAIYPMNLEGASPKDYEELSGSIEQAFGKLDGLLHNAALLGTLTPFEHYDLELWYKVMQVNVNAAFHITQACLPLLRKPEHASLIFTSSDVGRAGKAYWGAYAASNHAIQGMMATLAAEQAEDSGLRVNCIDPGPVRTSMRAKAYPAENKEALATPEQIIPAYLYLMGDDSLSVQGETIIAQ